MNKVSILFCNSFILRLYFEIYFNYEDNWAILCYFY